MLQSVVARIHGGHYDSNHLALRAGQRPWGAHEFHIQIVMLSHHSAMDTVYENDVIAVRHAILVRDLVVGLIGYERHVTSVIWWA